MSYFLWQRDYRVRGGPYYEGKVFCFLCNYMFENEGRTKIVPDFPKWLYEDSECPESHVNNTDTWKTMFKQNYTC